MKLISAKGTHTMIVSKTGVMSSVLAMAIVLSLFSSTSLAYVDIDPGTVLAPPTVTGSFSVSQETTGSYVEPTNTFDDGNPTIQSKEAPEKDRFTFIGCNTKTAVDSVTYRPRGILSITEDKEEIYASAC